MLEPLYVIWAHRPGETTDDDRPIGQFRTRTDAEQSFAAAVALGYSAEGMRIVFDDGSAPNFGSVATLTADPHAPAHGAVIKLELAGASPNKRRYALAEPIIACTDWDAAEFRYPNPIREWRWKHATACNIRVTGRTAIRADGCYWVRVAITWVGDCEPDTHSRGLMRVHGPGDLRPVIVPIH